VVMEIGDMSMVWIELRRYSIIHSIMICIFLQQVYVTVHMPICIGSCIITSCLFRISCVDITYVTIKLFVSKSK
jgi:hypothetical protein